MAGNSPKTCFEVQSDMSVQGKQVREEKQKGMRDHLFFIFMTWDPVDVETKTSTAEEGSINAE